MTTFSDLFPDGAALMGRKWFKLPGNFNFAVPAGVYFIRASVLGVGGQGENWGGGSAFARAIFPTTPTENLKIQVGRTAQADVPGDSWVKRNDNTVLVYADRGRGSSAPGLAINSVGDVRRDGTVGGTGGVGGEPASDAADYGGVGFWGGGARSEYNAPARAADYGGGGVGVNVYGEYSQLVGVTAYPAGGGLVCLEFFNANPGY